MIKYSYKKYKVLKVNNSFDKRVLPDWMKVDLEITGRFCTDEKSSSKWWEFLRDFSQTYNPISGDMFVITDKELFDRYFKQV